MMATVAMVFINLIQIADFIAVVSLIKDSPPENAAEVFWSYVILSIRIVGMILSGLVILFINR